jgi:hypothetical protein
MKDGGAWAIKGFVFQFDKSLLEILAHPQTMVEIEQIQDLGYEDYCLQVKHRNQNFTPSSIRGAVESLLTDFSNNRAKKYCLYCYFKDQSPHKKQLSYAELERVLGRNKGNLSDEQKRAFIKNFEIEFSENYENQFKLLIQKIKDAFGLDKDLEALNYHAIFQNYLLRLATNQTVGARRVAKSDLDRIIKQSEEVIFYCAYAKYLGKSKYLGYLRREYFTFRKINIPRVERLFIVEATEDTTSADVIKIIMAIKNKYYRIDNSPAPFVCIRNGMSLFIKQRLWERLAQDKETFSDGTHFNGDRFRYRDLLAAADHHNRISVKIVEPAIVNRLMRQIEEVYEFYISQPLLTPRRSYKQFCVSPKDVIKLIS